MCFSTPFWSLLVVNKTAGIEYVHDKSATNESLSHAGQTEHPCVCMLQLNMEINAQINAAVLRYVFLCLVSKSAFFLSGITLI